MQRWTKKLLLNESTQIKRQNMCKKLRHQLEDLIKLQSITLTCVLFSRRRQLQVSHVYFNTIVNRILVFVSPFTTIFQNFINRTCDRRYNGLDSDAVENRPQTITLFYLFVSSARRSMCIYQMWHHFTTQSKCDNGPKMLIGSWVISTWRQYEESLSVGS